ncbi:transporter substrate-binding domain-containing protein [Oceanobacillus sp. Castelsardo]|uniref:transporter substrate-binding domain-containing protein n=1 Tax=Oceanobacillus sp. Castelsardo TaxID=1851204 RepID=UPI0008394155|nr:transporter substrate-binding domain-containing protein [Oceanobacillus sp. Castelsardo]
MKKILVFIGLISFSILLAACGSDSASGDGESESGVRTIEVAVPPAAKPLSYTENGELTGYEVEILKKVDEKLLDYEFNIVGVGDSAAEVGLDTGKYDLIAQGMFLSEEREEKYLIPSESNGASLMKIYMNEDNKDIETLEDLVGRNISPPNPSGGVFNFLTNYNEENPDNPIEFKTSDSGISYADRLKEVESGKYDALVLPSNLGQNEIIDQAGLQIHTTEPVKIFPTYFLIHKTEENELLNEEVSKALSELKEDGTLSELSVKYYGEDVFQYE